MPLPYAEPESLHEAGVVLGGLTQFIHATTRAARRSATAETPLAPELSHANAESRGLAADPAAPSASAAAARGAAPSPARATPGAASAYRLVIEFADGCVRVAREVPSKVVAETAVRSVLHECAADGLVRRIVLQAGTVGAGPRYDALRIIPGETGGWSRTQWTDARVWNEAELARAELLGVPPAAPPTYRGYAWQAVGSVGALLMLWFAAWMVLVR